MPLMGRQRRCLEAMGIPVWLLRQGRVSVAAAPDAGAVAAAATPAAVPAPAPAESADDSVSAKLLSIEQQVAKCVACDLHRERKQTVFGVGNEQAEWMLVGEAPGAEEDRLGEPFVGKAGKLLDAMLAAISLDRDRVYIANIVKCRPPGNRNPHQNEVDSCIAWLKQQIGIVQPRIILAVGRVAAHSLLVDDSPVSRLRGQKHMLPDMDIPVVVSYHPAYLLRTPADKAKAWQDLLFAKRVHSEGAGT